jgi:hypothetical protein
MGNSASNISSVVAPAAKVNDPYVTQSYVDSNFLTNSNFTTYDNYAKSNYLSAGTLTNTLANYPTNTSLNNTLANSTLYCPPDQTYCSLSNSKAGPNSIVATNGNIGIGTITPSEELHINRSSATNVLTKYTNTNAPSGLDIGVDSTGNGIIFHRDSTRPIQIATNNIERMRVSEGGNVGIGTTSPIHRLDIATATRSGTHATTTLPVYITGNINESSNGVEIRHTDGTRGIGIGTTTIYAAGSNANQNLNIIPKGTGMVGIGTTNPTQRLDVSGNINASGNITNSGSLTTNNINASNLSISSLFTGTSGTTVGTSGRAITLPNNWSITIKPSTLNTAVTQLCFTNGTIDYVCIDPAKTS